MSRKEQVAATFLRLCLVYVEFLALRVKERPYLTMLWLDVLF